MRISDWSSDVCSSDLREHGRGQRIGDLILDYLRRLPGIAGTDYYLDVRKIGQRIDRGIAQGPDARQRQGDGRQRHEEAVGDRGVDQARDHRPMSRPGASSIPRPSIPVRLASESSRNWPETATPSTRPTPPPTPEERQ